MMQIRSIPLINIHPTVFNYYRPSLRKRKGTVQHIMYFISVLHMMTPFDKKAECTPIVHCLSMISLECRT